MQVPSWLSTQLMSALDGPSMARDKPPGGRREHDEWIPELRTGSRRTWASTFASVFGVHSEDSWLVDRPVDQTWTVGAHVPTVHVVHEELQGTSCEGQEEASGLPAHLRLSRDEDEQRQTGDVESVVFDVHLV